MARPPSAAYQLRKLVVRHKAVSAVVIIVFLAPGVFAIQMSIHSSQLADERDQARQAQVVAENAERIAQQERDAAEHARRNALAARDAEAEARKHAEDAEAEAKREAKTADRVSDFLGDLPTQMLSGGLVSPPVRFSISVPPGLQET